MSVRRAEAELRWCKRNRESTGTMRESTGTSHTASRPRNGDSVSYFYRSFSLPVSAWAALQIQAL